MGEYYGVVRAPNYLSHALERGSGAVGVYKNHKYIARAMTTSGKYRYFYDSVELAAYKNQRTKQTNSLTKLSDSPAGPASSQSKSLSKGKVINDVNTKAAQTPNTRLSAGALKNQGENSPDKEPIKKKKKKTVNRRSTVRTTTGVATSPTSIRYYRR